MFERRVDCLRTGEAENGEVVQQIANCAKPTLRITMVARFTRTRPRACLFSVTPDQMHYPAGGEIQSRVCAEVDCGALLSNAHLVQRTAKDVYACDTIAVVSDAALGRGFCLFLFLRVPRHPSEHTPKLLRF
jgi:hypothetical protein